MNTPSTRNIMRTFRAATPEQRQAGKRWYREARSLAVSLDPSDPRRAAAVIAVLSPLKSWEQNVKLAQAAYAGEPIRTLGEHVRKVEALLNGADPDKVVSGQKVRSFWLSICDPDNPESAVIDRHAIAAACGHVLSDAERAPLTRGKAYKHAAELYARAAKIASRETGEPWNVSDLQAAVWVAFRDSHAYERVVA